MSTRPTLEQLEMNGDFVRRHIGPGEEQTAQMLQHLGLASLDELVQKTVPAAILDNAPLEPAPPIVGRELCTELMVEREPIASQLQPHSR